MALLVTFGRSLGEVKNMLCLTRKINESIQIGESIEVRILSIQGNRVKIGIAAPEEIRIRRSELVLEVPLARDTRRNGHRGSQGQPLPAGERGNLKVA